MSSIGVRLQNETTTSLNTVSEYTKQLPGRAMYTLHYPTSDITQRHLVNYDKLLAFDSELPVRYFAFPQKGVTLFILKNAFVESDGLHITISKNSEKNLQAVFLGKYLHPLMITYMDYVEEVAVNFNETGINHFFPGLWTRSSLVTVLQGESIGLDTEKLFNTNNESAIAYLDNYLVGRYSPLSIPGIERAIALINHDPTQTVADIAAQVFLTEKTLNRQFQKYVGCTISKYKSIVRFRNTIGAHFKNRQLSLTELCLENDYFDSPHFYKEIKKIASFNPKDFFNKVKANGLGSYPYIFD